MTKVFALLILSLFSASQVNATQFGEPTMGDDQFMGDNDANIRTNGNDDPGMSAGSEDYGMNDDTAGSGYDDTEDSQGTETGSPSTNPDDDDTGFQSTGDQQQPDSSQMMGQPQQFPPAGQDMDNGNDDAQAFPQNGAKASFDSPSATPAATSTSMPSEEQHQHKLKGMKYIKQLQNALLEGNKQKLCGDGGVCRQSFGEGCSSSKNFLSVCAAFCSDVHDFRGSHCINNGAKRYNMNPQTFVYAARPQKQKRAENVIQHVMVQLREGRKALRDDKRFFFNVLCTPPSIQMIPQRDRYDISRACLDFLYNGYPPESAIQQLENSNVIQAPTSPQMPETQADPKTPLGGLPPANGKDLGAKYNGKLPPIIEDKEDVKDNSKKNNHQKKTKKHKVKKQKPPLKTKKPKSEKQDVSQPKKASSAKSQQGTQSPKTTPYPPQPAKQPQNNAQENQNTDDTSTTKTSQGKQPQPTKDKKKKDGLLGELEGTGGIGGLVDKLTHKKEGQQDKTISEIKGFIDKLENKNADTPQDKSNGTKEITNIIDQFTHKKGDQQKLEGKGSSEKKDKISSTVGKFLKF